MFPPKPIILILLASLPFASPFYILNYTTFSCGAATDLFSANSTYSSNLDNLLSNISSSSLSTGFTTYMSGSSTSDVSQTDYNTSESVYGLALCRGDISSFNCTSCISAAIASLRSNCSFKKEAVVWREWCTLRYSDRYIFSTLEVEPNATLRNVNIVSGDSWSESLNATLWNVTENAAVGGRGKKFATEVASYVSSAQKIYAMAQCTPDLSEDECRKCLQVAVGLLWVTREGSIALLPSCNVRYEMYSFYFTKTDTTTVDYPLPPAPLPSPNEYAIKADLQGNRRVSYSKVVVAVIALLAVALVVLIGIFTHLLRRRISAAAPPGRKRLIIPRSLSFDFSSVRPIEYDFRAIQDATKDFSIDNKIGQGGFGVVYKGELSDGRMIAVKKLDKRGQDFKSEVISLAKVQHQNLVRLLGYRSTPEESLLVYEYVPNHNLSYFLFDPTKQGLRDWPTRFEIINGIAQGMLYLHEHSSPTIIHRDLKPSNILLDMNMRPKIGDFGLARIFGADQTHEKTMNIAGTTGYMAPEYMLYGDYSPRSDVYSFGVLVLEIVSGKKNTSFHETGLAGDLLSYAWEKWIQRTPLALLDPTLAETSPHSSDQVISCIKIAISCIQKEKHKRPLMSKIVSLLGRSASNNLPSPQQPYHYYPRTDLEPDQAANRPAQCNSINHVTITELEPR